MHHELKILPPLESTNGRYQETQKERTWML